MSSEDIRNEKVAENPALADSGLQATTSSDYDTDAIAEQKRQEELFGPAPSAEETKTLRKVTGKLSYSLWLVALVELCERFTYYGISGPFQNYMQKVLKLPQSSSTALSYFFQFWCYVTPIPAAMIADTWTGKYWAIFGAAWIYVCGNLILFVTSLPSSLEAGAGMGGLAAAMVVIGLGTGGIKSNVSPMIADQYTATKAYTKDLQSGEKVIVDPQVTYQTIFLIFYFCVNFGSLSVIATTFLEDKVGFWAAYLLPFCFFFVGIIALVIGKNNYIKRPPQGSVIPDTAKICVIAAKNGFKLDAAKPSVRRQNGEQVTEGWSDLFVEEVRRALAACKVFVFYPIFWCCYGQMVNNFVSQAGVMELHGIPNDVMQSVNSIAIMIFIPIVNRFLYPLLRKIGIQMKPITRITWGFYMAACSMAYAAIVQHLVYSAGPCYKSPMNCPAGLIPGTEDEYYPNEVHVAVQTPAYVFMSFAEIFASVTGLEYAYTKAPANMKSFITSMFLVTNAFGSALGIALSPTAKDPHLLWMYVGLCCASVVAGSLFWLIFHSYNDKEEEWNVIDAEYRAEMNEQLKSKQAAERSGETDA